MKYLDNNKIINLIRSGIGNESFLSVYNTVDEEAGTLFNKRMRMQRITSTRTSIEDTFLLVDIDIPDMILSKAFEGLTI
jgi:hypothetical protein